MQYTSSVPGWRSCAALSDVLGDVESQSEAWAPLLFLCLHWWFPDASWWLELCRTLGSDPAVWSSLVSQPRTKVAQCWKTWLCRVVTLQLFLKTAPVLEIMIWIKYIHFCLLLRSSTCDVQWHLESLSVIFSHKMQTWKKIIWLELPGNIFVLLSNMIACFLLTVTSQAFILMLIAKRNVASHNKP